MPKARDLHLSIERPAHAARYRELAPARVHFGDLEGSSGRLVLPAALLNRPLPTADAQARQAAEARCKGLLNDIVRRGDWSGWCAMILREAEDHQPTLNANLP